MTLADDLAAASDLLDRLEAAMRTIDRDGRNLEGRIRDRMLGHPRAASYDGSRSGRDIPDPTGNNAIRSDTAAGDLRALRGIAASLRRQLDTAVTIAQAYEPRAATDKERREVDASNDPGCDSCARTEVASGVARWEPRYNRTTRCRWCYEWEKATGEQPTLDQLRRHHAGLMVRRPVAS